MYTPYGNLISNFLPATLEKDARGATEVQVCYPHGTSGRRAVGVLEICWGTLKFRGGGGGGEVREVIIKGKLSLPRGCIQDSRMISS